MAPPSRKSKGYSVCQWLLSDCQTDDLPASSPMITPPTLNLWPPSAPPPPALLLLPPPPPGLVALLLPPPPLLPPLPAPLAGGLELELELAGSTVRVRVQRGARVV